jgi:fibronectin-binding autotransporter adhesin
MKSTLLLFLVALLLQLEVNAAVRTWSAPGGGSWTDASNWGGTAPVNTDSVVFNAGTFTVTNVPNGFIAGRLTKNGTGIVTLDFTGILNVTGNIDVSGDGIVFGTGSTVRVNGSGTQSIGGVGTTTFAKLIINKANSFSRQFSGLFNIVNPVNVSGNLVVSDSLLVQQGILSLSEASSTTITHQIGTLSLGSATSTITTQLDPFVFGIFFRTDTGLFINNSLNKIVTVNVLQNFIVNATYTDAANGRCALQLSTPAGDGGSSTLNIAGNFLATSRVAIVGTGRQTTPAVTNTVPTFLNIGTPGDGNTGDFVMTSSTTASEYRGDGNGFAVAPLISLRGGTSVNPADYNIPFDAYAGGPTRNARANLVVDAGSVYRVPNGSSVTLPGDNGYSLQINGTLTVEPGGEIAGASVGTVAAGTGNPVLLMGANGLLRIQNTAGIGPGTGNPSTTGEVFQQRTALLQWNLTAINTAGTVEYNAATTQTLTSRTGTEQYNNLVISGGAKTMPASSQTNTLTLTSGNVTTGANTLTVLNPAASAITGGSLSSFVNGNLARTFDAASATRFYPIGNSVYRPVSLTGATSSGTSALTGRIVSGNANSLAPSNAPLIYVSRDRYYQFTNAPTNPITLTDVNAMQINADDGVNAVNPNLTIKVATRTGGNWISQGPAAGVNVSSFPASMTSDNFSASPITVAASGQFFTVLGTTNPDNPLPVQLISFSARRTSGLTRLAWQTGFESDSRGFVVKRRKLGETEWRDIASYDRSMELRSTNRLNGAAYRFVDRTPVDPGTTLEYQLAEISLSGMRVELPMTATLVVPRQSELAQNFPNPFNPSTEIRYQVSGTSDVRLEVFDMLGRKVATLVSERQDAGEYQVKFNAAGLASGVYFYRIDVRTSGGSQAGAFVETRKMMLMK